MKARVASHLFPTTDNSNAAARTHAIHLMNKWHNRKAVVLAVGALACTVLFTANANVDFRSPRLPIVKTRPARESGERYWRAVAEWRTVVREVKFEYGSSNAQLGPAFDFMLPEQGDGDTEQPLKQGLLEPFVTTNMAEHLGACCANGGHFTDVGGNYGWFALLAAKMGCYVDSFEPMPHFAALMEYNIFDLNGVDPARVKIHKGVIVGEKAGESVMMRIPAGATGMASLASTVGEPWYVTSTTLDAMMESFIGGPGANECGLKVDVEGYEPFVFNGARRFMHLKNPRAVIIENSPAMTTYFVPGPRNEEGNPLWETTYPILGAMVQRMWDQGYKSYRYHWGKIKNTDLDYIANALMKDEGEDADKPAEKYAACGWNCMMYLSRDDWFETQVKGSRVPYSTRFPGP